MFFVVAIVQLIVNIITTNSDDSGLWNCICKFVGCSAQSNNSPAGGGNQNIYVPN